MQFTKQPDQTASSPGNNLGERAKKTSKYKILLQAVIVFLLLAGVGAGVFYWQQQNVDRLNKTNQDLTSQLSTAKASLAAANSGVVYMAKYGKFTLTLPKEYGVIVNEDGGGEGGPFNSIQIGDVQKTNLLAGGGLAGLVSVGAVELHGKTFRELVDSELKDSSPVVKQASIQIDGASAEVYLVGGLAAPKKVYFTKNDFFYSIYLSDNNDATNKKLDAIVSGFKFN